MKSSWKTMMFLSFSCSIQSNRCVCQFAFQEQFIEKFFLGVHHVSTIWYGSSFLRELYLEAERLNHNIQTRQNCDLPPWAQKEAQKRQIEVNGHVNVSIYPPICRLSSQDWHAMDTTFPATDDATCFATAICTNLRQYELL